MKQIVILGSKDFGEKNNPALITEALQGQLADQALATVYIEDLFFNISTAAQAVVDRVSGHDLAEVDMVVAMNWYKSGSQSIYRDVAFTIALYLEARGKKFWNQEMLHQRSTTKLSAMMQLALADLPIPNTLFSLTANHLPQDTLSYPLIAKDLAASRGRNNYLMQNTADLQSTVTTGQDSFNRLLLQEFIPNDGDLRIVCFGGQPQLVIKRRKTDEATHLNNVSQGGSADLLDVGQFDPKIIENCKQICYIMGRNIAGIDLLFDQNDPERYVFLEVNAIPQLINGVYADQKMAALAQALTQAMEG